MMGLSIKNIYKKYKNKPLLTGLTFDVENGETVCLLGASGSGKSTILRIIAGLEEPDSGSILWNDEDLRDVPTFKRRFGFMFQDYALFPHMTVAENVAFGLNLTQSPPEEIQTLVEETLKRYEMQGYGSRRVDGLSGGEQQRIALARTLAPSPRLLLLDEPLAALDRSLRAHLLQEIRDVLHKSGTPAIYVTHDQEEAFAIADRLLILQSGCIKQSGSPEEVYRNPVSLEVAKFFGLNNIIRGILSDNGSKKFVRTDPGDFSVLDEVVKDRNIKIGTPVSLIMRKARLADAQNSKDKGNIISTRVEDCTFGETGYRAVVKVMDITLEFMLERNVPIGGMIQLIIDPMDINVLQED